MGIIFNNHMDIKVRQDFKSLIPPLTSEEYEGLEQSIIKEGCRDAVVLWQDIIIDGHNRYDICTKHCIEFKTTFKDFNNERDVKEWMILNQFGRRNISAYDRSKLALQLKPIIAEKAKENQKIYGGNQYERAGLQKSAKVQPIDTRAELAKQAGVSHDTIHKVEVIEQKATPEIKEKLQRQEISINKAFQDIKKEEKQEKLLQKKEDNKELDKSGIKEVPIVHHESFEDFLNKLDDNVADLLITDPPFSTDIDDITSFANRWLPLALSKVNKSGRGYICIGAYPEELKAYIDIFLKQDKFILDNPLIWTYRNTLGVTPKRKYNLNYQVILHFYSKDSADLDTSITNEMFSVQDINAPDGRIGDRFHKWQKPNELARRLIQHSSKEGDIVIDPFCGSGAFLVQAGKMNRIADGCDIDIEAINLCKERGCYVQ